MTDKQKNLPWHVVEKAINKEVNWLKDVIPTRSESGILTSLEGRPLKCDACYYTYRKIALLIVTGKIKAREIKARGIKDLWDGLTDNIDLPQKQKHGGEWHRKMMDVLEQFFKSQDYEITIEPHLNYGRADLGIYKNGKKNLFIEVGTVSVYKLWVNIQTIKDAVFLVVPSENKVIEFET